MTNDSNIAGTFNPFPGLRAFEEEEEHLFFGREKQVDELLAKLSQQRFLAVIGSSGSGKSSLVRSGLLPALFRGFMTGAGSSWKIAVMRPGNAPIANLAAALASFAKPGDDPGFDDTASVIIESTLRRSRLGLGDAAEETLRGKNENVLIVVDQFEELFRFSRYEKESNHGERDALAFVNLLLEAASRPGLQLYVAITMRSDFLGNCTEFRGLPEAINRGLYLIPRMTRDEIRSAITGPVAVGGGTITSMLVSRLLNDVGDNPDQLPILQHSLMRTWQYRQQEKDPAAPLDIRHYEQAGTMKHALSQHAEEAYSELDSERLRETCESIFRSLTEKRPDMPGTRRPTSIADLAAIAGASEEEVMRVVNVFRSPERSFLVPPHTVPLASSTVIDISHESLMRVWERLVQWVEEEAESAEIFLRLVKAAQLYQNGKGGLYRSPELDFAVRWRDQQHPTEAWGAKFNSAFGEAMAFLSESEQRHREEEEQKLLLQKRKKKRAIVFTVAGVILLCSLSAGMMYIVEENTLKETARIVDEIDEARSLSLKASHLADDYRDSSRMLQASEMALESYDMLKSLYPADHFHPDVVNFLALDKIFWAEKQSNFHITEEDTISAIINLYAPGRAAFITQDKLYVFGLDPKNGLTASVVPVSGHFDHLAVSSGDQYIAAGSESGKLAIFSRTGNTFRQESASPDSSGGAVIGMDFSGSRMLTVVRRSPGKLAVELLELPAYEKKSQKELPLDDNAIVLVSHSRIVVAGGQQIVVYAIEASGARLMKTITGLDSPVSAVAVSADGKWISWGTKDGDVFVNEIGSAGNTGRELPRLSHAGEITSLLFYTELGETDSGKIEVPFLASGGCDGQVVMVRLMDALSKTPKEDPLIIISNLSRISEMEYNTGAYMMILKDGPSISAHIINMRLLVAEVRAIRDSLQRVVGKQ